MSGVPKSLLGADGEPRRPPKAARRLFVCPVCRAELERAASYWGCPKVLGHVGLLSDRELLRRLAELAPSSRRWTPLGVLRTQLRIRRRLGIRLPRERET